MPVHTGEKVNWRPTRPASRELGDSPDLFNNGHGGPKLEHKGSKPIMSRGTLVKNRRLSKAVSKIMLVNRLTAKKPTGRARRDTVPPPLRWSTQDFDRDGTTIMGAPGSARSIGSALERFAAAGGGPPSLHKGDDADAHARRERRESRRMSVSMRTVSKLKLEAKHDRERLEETLEREHERQRHHTEERLKRRASKKRLLSTAAGKELAALAEQADQHMHSRRRRATRVAATRPSDGGGGGGGGAAGFSVPGAVMVQEDGMGEHGGGRRMSVSSRTLHELRAEGRRDAEDLLLAMEQEKARQHEHMLSRLKKRKASRLQLKKEGKAASR